MEILPRYKSVITAGEKVLNKNRIILGAFMAPRFLREKESTRFE